MSKKKKSPMPDISDPGYVFYDEEERELAQSALHDEWVRLDPKKEKEALERARNAARATSAKTDSVSLRFSPFTLKQVRIKALEAGMPYQTYITSLVHMHVTGGGTTRVGA